MVQCVKALSADLRPGAQTLRTHMQRESVGSTSPITQPSSEWREQGQEKELRSQLPQYILHMDRVKQQEGPSLKARQTSEPTPRRQDAHISNTPSCVPHRQQNWRQRRRSSGSKCCRRKRKKCQYHLPLQAGRALLPKQRSSNCISKHSVQSCHGKDTERLMRGMLG